MSTRLMILIIIFLILPAVLVSGCGEGPPADRNDDQLPDPGMVDVSGLEAEGVYVISISERDGILHITGTGLDQRALNIIADTLGPDIPFEAAEEPEMLFIRGTIQEVNPAEDDTRNLGTIFVEGEEEADTGTDAAFIFVRPATRILRPDADRLLALTFEALEVGQEVEITVTGPVLTIYPPQAGASTITIQ